MAARTPEHTVEGAAGGDEHVVVFRLAAEHYALDIQAVQEIVRIQAITTIPGADHYVEGITNLRGRVVPVVDLRRRCGLPVSEVTAETRIVVVSSSNGMVGLIVDAVSEVLRIRGEQIEPPSTIVRVPENSYLRGIAKLDDRLISLMDLSGILPSDDSLALGADEAARAA
ncbi:MAG: purine-binding chemotaxis protein CheW [Dehalococcoidia bacterium]|nr:purine-binding chemotaxis protein CheW [Dehalococcoidia bacterium]